MSFDTFRDDLISRISDKIALDEMDAVLLALDSMASSWDFAPKQTGLIVADGLPDVVRLYIASKSVENIARGTLCNYLQTLRVFFHVVRRNLEDISADDVRLFLSSQVKQTS